MSKGAVEALSFRTLTVELSPRWMPRSTPSLQGFVATPMSQGFRKVPGVAERRAGAALGRAARYTRRDSVEVGDPLPVERGDVSSTAPPLSATMALPSPRSATG